MVTDRHHFRGRPDRRCDDCHRPDRDPVHYTQVELDRGIDTDDLERGDANDNPGVAEQRGSGAHVTGPAVDRLIGYHIDGQIYPPADVELVYEAADDEAPPPTTAGPPDLDQAIQAATQALAGQLFGTPEQLARYASIAVEAAAPLLAGDLRQHLGQANRDTAEARSVARFLLDHLTGQRDDLPDDLPGRAGSPGRRATMSDADKHVRMLRYLVEWPHNTDGDEEIDAYEAGADALEQLHTTRQRLDDLQGEYELTKGNFADFAEQQLERNRQHAVQIEEMDRVVSLAHATAAEARQQLKQLRSLMEAYIAEHDAIQPWEWAERFIVALDQPKAQEANP